MASERILIVEDNEKNLKLVRDLLQLKGYQTMDAKSGEEGVEVARSAKPDLILMDIRLPGMDGITTLGHLRADEACRHIPVIALTAQAMAHDREQIIAAGFDGYHTKPINIRELPETIRKTLDERSSHTSHHRSERTP